jgi:hypothetical protein
LLSLVLATVLDVPEAIVIRVCFFTILRITGRDPTLGDAMMIRELVLPPAKHDGAEESEEKENLHGCFFFFWSVFFWRKKIIYLKITG